MRRDDLAGRLRSALDGGGAPTAAVTEPAEPTADTPLRVLRQLAASAESEAVRLRAAQILHDRQEAARERRRARSQSPWHDEIAQLSDAELEHEWDAFCGVAIVHAALGDGPSSFPLMAAEIRRAVAERAEERARELADADRIEAEIERRAQVRATRLYQSEFLAKPPRAAEPPPPPEVAPQASPAARGSEKPASAPEQARQTPAEPPPGLTWDDLERGWPHRKPRGVYRLRPE